jgi:hypothetical protein
MKKALVLVIFIAGIFALDGCGGNSAPPPPITVSVSPSSALMLDVNQSVPITATANNDPGNQGFDWALTCRGGNCGTISAHSASGSPATFTAPNVRPSSSVTITTKLTGLANSNSIVASVSSRPTVATNGAITAATLNTPYTFQLAANGGAGTLTWALSGGTSLPDTLTLSGTGMIVGTPSGAGGMFNFNVHVTDSGNPPITSPDVPLSIKVSTPPIIVSLSQTSAAVALNRTKEFIATVTNDTSNGNVDWTLTLNGATCQTTECGSVSPTITASGVPITYTAPASLPPSTLTLTATTVDGTPPATTSATVTVTAHGFGLTGSMATAREFHQATLLDHGPALTNGKVLVTGGDAAEAELFDPGSGTFTSTGSMKTTRSRHTATLLNDGKVLVTGGLDSNNQALASAELFDPGTGTFTLTNGRMETARAYQTATLLNDGTVLVAGGFDGNTGLATAEVFDPNSGMFTPTNGNMETPRFDHTATLLDHGSALTNGKVLVTGGSRLNRTEYATAELFDPHSRTFTPTNRNMKTPRAFHTATLLHDGTVLVTGGVVTVGNRVYVDVATAEVFDPNSGFFSSKGSMIFARARHTATLLSDGITVLVTGGGTAELFDPANGFTRTGDMVSPRADHTATLLKDGTVLLTGGDDGSGTALATAELYR